MDRFVIISTRRSNSCLLSTFCSITSVLFSAISLLRSITSCILIPFWGVTSLCFLVIMFLGDRSISSDFEPFFLFSPTVLLSSSCILNSTPFVVFVEIFAVWALRLLRCGYKFTFLFLTLPLLASMVFTSYFPSYNFLSPYTSFTFCSHFSTAHFYVRPLAATTNRLLICRLYLSYFFVVHSFVLFFPCCRHMAWPPFWISYRLHAVATWWRRHLEYFGGWLGLMLCPPSWIFPWPN